MSGWAVFTIVFIGLVLIALLASMKISSMESRYEEMKERKEYEN